MTGCLKGREVHPQEDDYGTRNGEWQMETKDAMTPVPAGAAKRLTKWLIRSLGGWLHIQRSMEILLDWGGRLIADA
jgi:hypothetical protein